MKKQFITLGLMFVAALTLTTNCAKEENAPEEAVNPVVKEGVPFELTVSSSDTKTSTTDAATISWVANDKLNVFHAENGSDEYGSNDMFTITSENLESSRFTGTLSDGDLDAGKTYDWYVLYPYSSYITTPANTSTGYTTLGSSSKSTPQVQEGYNSKAHLAGQYFPLYGKVTNVPAATSPSITLNQALSVVKIHVTNTKTTPLTVTSAAFTAPQPITGRFYIDFSGETPSFTVAGDGNVSNTANLTVNSGTPIAKDGSADFYIAVKPFTATVGSKIKIYVNGEEKTVTVSGSDVTFQPGKIKTINYSYDADPTIYSTAFDYPLVKDGGSTYYNKGDKYEGVDEGGETSWYITYGNWAGGNSAQFRVYNSGGGFGELAQKFDCSHVTYVTYDAVANNDLTSLTLTPYYSTDKGANWTAISDDAKVITTTSTTYKFTVSSTGEHDCVRVKLVVSGSRPGSSNTQITIDNLKICGTGSILSDPAIIASNVTDIPALGGSGKTLTYTIKNFSGSDDITAAGDNTVVDASAVVSPAGTVTYAVNPNYGTAARSGSITLSSAAEGINKVVSVAQLGETFSSSATTVTIPKDATTETFTITTPTFGWTAVANAADGKNLTISGATSGSGSASAQTITVSSTTAVGAEEQTLGTIVIYRNGNESDPQKKTITIKKASNAAASSYTKVTTITSGAEYLFVEPTAGKVVESLTYNRLRVTAVTVSDGTKITGNATIDGYVLVITALTGDDTGYYSIKIGDDYIGWTSSTSFSTSATVSSNNYKWSISFDGDGRAEITNKAQTKRKIAYNGSTDFRPYSEPNTSTYPYPVLFKKD